MTACGACGRRVVCAVQSGVGNACPGAAVFLGARTRFPYRWQDPEALGLETTDEDALRGDCSTSPYLYYPPRGSRRSAGC